MTVEQLIEELKKFPKKKSVEIRIDAFKISMQAQAKKCVLKKGKLVISSDNTPHLSK